MQEREAMIEARDPLRHPVVVGIFSFEQELEHGARGHSGRRSAISAEAAIRPNASKRGISVRD